MALPKENRHRLTYWTEEPGGLQSMGSDTTERLHFDFSLSRIGEGNGNPLQYSCLENPSDGGAWWAAIYGVAQSRTRLKRLTSISSNLLKAWLEQKRRRSNSFSLTLRLKNWPSADTSTPVSQAFILWLKSLPSALWLSGLQSISLFFLGFRLADGGPRDFASITVWANTLIDTKSIIRYCFWFLENPDKYRFGYWEQF